MRIGHGYDVHRLAPDRALILGGVHIPHPLGLLGHSDADVLVHAVMDALLGAAALGDIGKLFPDTDPQYKGIDSLLLLERVRERIAAAWRILVTLSIWYTRPSSQVISVGRMLPSASKLAFTGT